MGCFEGRSLGPASLMTKIHHTANCWASMLKTFQRSFIKWSSLLEGSVQGFIELGIALPRCYAPLGVLILTLVIVPLET